jgi:cytochrome b
LAIAFVTAYISGDFDDTFNFHFAFGAFAGAIISFRLIYGLFGPRYSRFKDFPVGIKSQLEFAKTFLSGEKTYPGHNPAASIVMLGILIIGLLCSLSGFFLYNSEAKVISLATDNEFFEGAHEVLANLFLAFVIIHLCGVLAELILHKNRGTIRSIFTGYKNIEAENAKMNAFQKFYAVLWIAVPFVLFFFAYGLKYSGQDKNESGNTEQFESEEDDD